MGDDDIMSTDDLLEAFRRKKAETTATGPNAEEDGPMPSSSKSPSEDAGPDDEGSASESPRPAGSGMRAMDPPDEPPAPRGPAGASTGAPEDAPSDAQTTDTDATEGRPAEERPRSDPDPADDGMDPSPAPDPEPGSDDSVEGPEEDPSGSAAPEPAGDGDPVKDTKTDEPEAAPEVKRSGPVSQTVPGEDPIVDVNHRPRGPAPGSRTLTPLDPALGLTQRLQKDLLVTRKGWPILRYAAATVTAIGVLLLTIDRYLVVIQDDPTTSTSWLTWVAIVLIASGGPTSAVLWSLAKEREMSVQFAASQAMEWQRAQERVHLFRILRWVGLGYMAVGPFVAIIVMLAASNPSSGVIGIIGIALFVTGAVLLVAGHFLHDIAVRNYIQTTVLWILERTGGGAERGAMDPRVPDVLRSLDALLAELPDSSVQAFMQTSEAKAYLELMESLSEA